MSVNFQQTYYVTVRANSETGSVVVTSDGVKVIQEGQIMEGASIKDGLGCDPENSKTCSSVSIKQNYVTF